jgi:deoxyinosine 3'endonuclease (endonuclease V)
MAEQNRLAELCIRSDHIDWCVHGRFIQGLNFVAGVDVSFFPDKMHAVAAVVVLSYPDMEVVYERCATFRLTVPYMVGFLAFREVPALKAMLEKVPKKLKPQVVLVDGNGVFHPRRCGSATHLGIVTDFPTIGVAKDVLTVDGLGIRAAAKIARKLQAASDWAPLLEDGETNSEPLAMLLRPQVGKKTLVVSVGHRVSLNSAVILTASLCKSTIPEPIRQADLRSRAAVRAWFDGISLAKLRLGAGDLLDIDVPSVDTAGNEPAAKRPRRDRISDEGRSAEIVESAEFLTTRTPSKKQKKTKGCGHASKPVLVWKVKTVGSEAACTSGTHLVNDTSADSISTRTPTMEESSENDEMVLVDDQEDSRLESTVWQFLTRSLCGLCMARSVS